MSKARDIILALIGLIAFFAGGFSAWMRTSMVFEDKRMYGEFNRGVSEFFVTMPFILCVIFCGGFTAVYFFKRAFGARGSEIMES